MQVNFVIAGVQKGGTTSLDAYLRQHPRLCMAKVKETHFFDNEGEFRTPFVQYENYHRFFRLRTTPVLYGEATPIYTYWPEAIPRIHRYNPAMRIVVLFRNPIERAWSAWRMEKNRGVEPLSFSEAIRREPERCRETAPLPHRVFSYVSRGLYSDQIRRVQQYFPGQALFLKSEHFFEHTSETVNQVIRFLGVDPHPVDTSTVYLRGTAEAGPNEADRKYLLDQFDHDITAVEQLLQWDCSDWRALRAPARAAASSLV